MTHGGNIRELIRQAERDDILDFSANLNPLGPPEWLRAVVSGSLSAVAHYPDPEGETLVEALAARFDVSPEEVVVGNGSTELLYALPRVLGKIRTIIPVPSYADYERASRLAGLQIDTVGDLAELGTDHAPSLGQSLVFVGHPNNPTGNCCDIAAVRAMAETHPDAFFIVDEAFIDFVENAESFRSNRPKNVAVLYSMTKTFSVPGLRIGACFAHPEVAQALRDLLPPWSVNTLAERVGAAALKDRPYLKQTREKVAEWREALFTELDAIEDISVFPGDANFLFCRIERNDLNAATLTARCLKQGVAIRNCDNYMGLDDKHFRVAVRTPDENARLLDVLSHALDTDRSRRSVVRSRKKPTIMFQGTSSNAGKSVLAAAMCRILLQDGYRVAPFKAQNMALNSYVTIDGLEMGRAQVTQAQACRLDPDVRMNPVLLKPNSDMGSQIIIMGKPVGNMDFRKYSDFKGGQAAQAAHDAYDSLSAQNDVMVLEGAGSPGEVNLKSRDICNMAMARYAQAPVLLVGDIDRGGVYASFVGTMEVLAEWERQLVAGYVVNRFRGDPSFLGEAHDYVKLHTERPVYGVVPYLKQLGLPEEDSVTFKSGVLDDHDALGDRLDIAVIDIPHISNFTDFDALAIEPDCRLRIVRQGETLGTPAALIIPGSKNTIGDLNYLLESGLGKDIIELAQSGKAEVVGVCGGFQILGEQIGDPHGVESEGQNVTGLGLLPVSTILAPEKTLTRTEAKHLESGLPLYGYEIHHGQTAGEKLLPLIERTDGECIGGASPDGNVWGTYLHGVFDADGFRRWFLDRLRVRKGLAPLNTVQARYNLEPALDRLADTVRETMDIKAIYKVMGL